MAEDLQAEASQFVTLAVLLLCDHDHTFLVNLTARQVCYPSPARSLLKLPNSRAG